MTSLVWIVCTSNTVSICRLRGKYHAERTGFHTMNLPLPPRAGQEIIPADGRVTDNVREWKGERFPRRPISPPTMLKLRNVDILVIEDRCKGCSFCIEFCPRDVLEESRKLNVRGVYPPRVKDAEECVGCGICEELCPDFAIFLLDKEGRR